MSGHCHMIWWPLYNNNISVQWISFCKPHHVHMSVDTWCDLSPVHNTTLEPAQRCSVISWTHDDDTLLTLAERRSNRLGFYSSAGRQASRNATLARVSYCEPGFRSTWTLIKSQIRWQMAPLHTIIIIKNSRLLCNGDQSSSCGSPLPAPVACSPDCGDVLVGFAFSSPRPLSAAAPVSAALTALLSVVTPSPLSLHDSNSCRCGEGGRGRRRGKEVKLDKKRGEMENS